MTVTRVEIRQGAYYDSVVLMHLQRALVDLPGVTDAGVVMATPANKDLLAEADLLPEEALPAKPDDLLMVVKAEDQKQAEQALEQVDELIAARRSTAVQEGFRPRSLDTARKALPQATKELRRIGADKATLAIGPQKLMKELSGEETEVIFELIKLRTLRDNIASDKVSL